MSTTRRSLGAAYIYAVPPLFLMLFGWALGGPLGLAVTGVIVCTLGAALAAANRA